MEEKLSSPPRHSALACHARLPYTLRPDPSGSEASPPSLHDALPIYFENAPALTPSRGPHSLTATASPMGKKIEGWAGAPGPMAWKRSEERRVGTERWPAMPVYHIHYALTRGVRKPPLLCIVIGVGRF